MVSACVGVASLIGLVVWTVSNEFPWSWALLESVVTAISLAAIAWKWLGRHIFHVVPSASFAHEFDEGPWLSFRGDPRTSIVVNWFTREVTDTRVELYFRNGDRVIITSVSGHIHHVPIDRLEPGTTYSYKLFDYPKDVALHEFTTAPVEPAPFKFVVIGDTQNGGGKSQEHWAYPPLLHAIAASKPALLVHTGDATDQGNDLVSWHEFLNASPRIIASTPFHVAVGNHDTGTHALADRGQKKHPDEGANYDYFFDYPYGTPRDEDEITAMRGRFYSFMYGNCLFVFVDTQTMRLANPGNPQWQWLHRILGTAPAGTWKVVIMHRDAVSVKKLKGTDVYAMDYDRFAPYLLPIFLEHDVDVVFQGHDHQFLHLAYEHGVNMSVPGVDPEISSGKVIHFITSGGGGNALKRNTPVLPAICTIHGFTRHENSSHFLVVDVGKDSLSIEARYPDGVLMEQVSINKQGA